MDDSARPSEYLRACHPAASPIRAAIPMKISRFQSTRPTKADDMKISRLILKVNWLFILGWLATPSFAADSEADAIKAIQKIGGIARVDKELAGKPVVYVALEGNGFNGDEAVRHLAAF